MSAPQVLDGVARVLLSLIFLFGGWAALTRPGARVDKVEDAGLPVPALMVRANGAAMVVGGAALALGLWVPFAAGLLLASLLPTTLVGHRFWAASPGPGRDRERIQFLKNTGLAGGLLLLVAQALAGS